MSIIRQSRRRKQPRRVRDRAAREHALISAAAKLFAARGYEAATTREIALHAGCAEGLIHRYFRGKSGLLMALIQSRVSRALVEMNTRLAPAPKLDQEIIQLVGFELKRVWEDQDFLKVMIPCAICHPAIGRVARKIGPQRRAQAIAERLRQFAESRALSRREIEAVAHFVGGVTFMFGFLQPVVLGHDRRHARELALSITRMFVRGFLARDSK
ncbi:MAG: helix-turn-helix domain-containing protein [Terriglobales bacterium]